MILTHFSLLTLLFTCLQLSRCQHGGKYARHDMRDDKNIRGSDESDPKFRYLFCGKTKHGQWLTEDEAMVEQSKGWLGRIPLSFCAMDRA